MSLGWSTDSTIYSNVPIDVKTQLDARKAIVSKRDSKRTDSDLLFLNSRTSWVKLSSGVDQKDEKAPVTSEQLKQSILRGERAVGTTNKLAKENILFGGTYNGKLKQGFTQDNNSSYGHSNQYGFKPMAGITNVAIKTQGSFGTIKKATVNFQVNSLDDLEKFEKLYLLPGFSMLLEWGHTLILDNETKEVSSGVKTYTNWFDNLENSDKKKDLHRSVNILKKLNKKRGENSYNYDAILGRVSNFIWSYTNEGVYDCSIDITGYGELTESLSALFQPGVSEEEKGVGVSNKFYGYLELIMNTIPFPCEDDNNLFEPFDLINYNAYEKAKKEILREFNNVFIANLNAANSDKGSGLASYKYITLGSFLNFINNHYQLKDNDVPFVKFFTNNFDTKTPQTNYKNKTPFVSFNDHISFQPDVCILPKPKDLKARIKVNIASSEPLHNCIKGETNDILNILVNVNLIKNIYSEAIANTSKEAINIYDIVRSLLNAISSSTGNINQLDLHYSDQVYYIVDRNITPVNNVVNTTFDLVGFKSLATNISLSSQIPSDLSNLIAIAASAGGSSITENVFNFDNFYDDVVDRIIPTRTQDDFSKSKQEKAAQERKKLIDNLDTVVSYFSRLNTKKIIPTTSMSNIKPAHQAVMNLLLKNEIITKKTNPPGLIPIQLSFDILGISGLRITDTFNIGPGLLPSRYKNNVSFTITGIDNKIESNQWITSISALMMITSVYEKTEKIVDDTSEIISSLQLIQDVDQEDESLFPNATNLRKKIEGEVDFVEKGYEITSSGNDITASTARGGIQLINQIKFIQSREGVKDLKWRFTGGHDEFHIFNPDPPKSSFHRIGKALDLAIQQDATIQQIEVASKIVDQARLMVNNITGYLNEYKKPSGHATGGHWHFTFS